MGFHTSHGVVYPDAPGVVTGTILKGLVENLYRECEAGDCYRSLSVRFGTGPATSNRPFFEWIPLQTPGIQVSSSKWDFEKSRLSAAALLDELQKLGDRSIHRAMISLGVIPDSVQASLRREPGKENSEGLYPCEVGLTVGKIKVRLDEDPGERLQAGWASVTISGNGYCFPWTHQELIDRCLKTKLCDVARGLLVSTFGPPKANPWMENLALCQIRTRVLPDRLIAAVQGI